MSKLGKSVFLIFVHILNTCGLQTSINKDSLVPTGLEERCTNSEHLKSMINQYLYNLTHTQKIRTTHTQTHTKTMENSGLKQGGGALIESDWERFSPCPFFTQRVATCSLTAMEGLVYTVCWLVNVCARVRVRVHGGLTKLNLMSFWVQTHRPLTFRFRERCIKRKRSKLRKSRNLISIWRLLSVCPIKSVFKT